jgi:PAS domain S-box-containing protein
LADRTWVLIVCSDRLRIWSFAVLALLTLSFGCRGDAHGEQVLIADGRLAAGADRSGAGTVGASRDLASARDLPSVNDQPVMAQPAPVSDQQAVAQPEVLHSHPLLSALVVVLVVATVASLLVWMAWRRADVSRQALAREQQRLQALMRTSSDGLHMLDRGGHLVEFSQSFAAMLGRSEAELAAAHIGSWEAGLSPDDVERLLRGFQIGERLDFSTRFRRADGRLIDVDVAAIGTHLDGADLLALAARDVTDKMRSLAALQASETFLDRTGRMAGVGGWAWNATRRCLCLTGQARRLLGLPSQGQPSQRQCLRVFTREARRQLIEDLRRAQRDACSSDLELPARTQQGRVLWLRWFAEPVFDDGRVVRWVGAVQDISERLASSAELQREQALRSEVEQVLRERGEMLDVLAHEVRQPLNNASAALQSAESTLRELGEQVAAPRLQRAQAVLGTVMARLDNTLAVASQLARPGLLDREEVEIDVLLAVVLADMPVAERPRVQLQRHTSARTASMDMGLMRLALRNLLSNALKFSPDDSPVIIRLSESEHPLGLVIDVLDQGPGVPGSVLPRLFQRGVRGAHVSSQGLGLYIVRRVMELHDSQVALVRSGPDGTTMRLVVVDPTDD